MWCEKSMGFVQQQPLAAVIAPPSPRSSSWQLQRHTEICQATPHTSPIRTQSPQRRRTFATVYDVQRTAEHYVCLSNDAAARHNDSSGFHNTSSSRSQSGLLSHSPTVLPNGKSLDDRLIVFLRHVKDQFLLSCGKTAKRIAFHFRKVLHLTSSERDTLLSTLTRAHNHMRNIETLLKTAVDHQESLSRPTVQFAYSQWSECHSLCTEIKTVLTHRFGGGNHIWRSTENIEVPNSVLHADGRGLGRSPVRGRPMATPSPRTRSPSMPSYHSIAARWQHNESGVRMDSITTTSWCSAAEEHRTKHIHGMQQELIDLLERHAADGESGRVAHGAMLLLTNIQEALSASEPEDAGEGAFAMWLGSLPPSLLRAVEDVLRQAE